MIPIDRVKWVTTQAALLAVPGAVSAWSPNVYPRAPGARAQAVTAKLARGLTCRAYDKVTEDAPTSILWTLASAADGVRVGLKVAKTIWYVDAPTGATIESLRDLLLAQLNADPHGEGVTHASRMLPDTAVAAVGLDGIRITSAQLGRLYEPIAFGPGASVTVEASAAAHVRTAQARGVIEFMALSAGAGPQAAELLGDLESALQGPDVREISTRAGVVLGRGALGDIVPSDALAGPTWESRATMRVAVALRSYRAVAVHTIETAALQGVTRNEAGDGSAFETEVTAP